MQLMGENMKLTAFTFLLFCSFFAKADNLSSKGQNDFYGMCLPSCKENQLKNPVNNFLLDKSFVFEAYCSCYCAKMALRISVKQANDFGKSALEGKPPPKEISDLVSSIAQVCMKPLFEK
jgi:hypothetical protein